MTLEVVGVGTTPNDGTGDTLRAAMGKVNTNFGYLGDTIITALSYGVVGNGVTNDTTNLQAAVTAAAGRTLYIPNGTYLITSSITIDNDTTIIMDPEAVIQSATTSISLLKATSKDRIVIRGGHLKYTAAGSTFNIGGIELSSCTNCLIEGIEFEGMQANGVLCVNTSHTTVRDNYIHDPNSTHGEHSDIAMMQSCTYCTVENNRCWGDGAFGVIFQDPSGATIPYRNKILHNNINEKTFYGIIVYQVVAQDTEHLIDGNIVYDILGTGVSGASGSGIYVQSSGGVICTNNRVYNCCRSTTLDTNAPAAISIAANGSLRRPNIVANNDVDAPKWRGISLSDSSYETICESNVIRYGDDTNGYGILVVDSSNTHVRGNRIWATSDLIDRPGISILATGADITGLIVSENTVTGGNANLIEVTRTSTHTTQGVFDGNYARSAGTAAVGMSCTGLVNSTISGNYLEGPIGGLLISGCSAVRGSGNITRVSAANAFKSTGTCSNVFFDESNDFGIGIAQARMQNEASGVNVTQHLSAAPTGGDWQVGDHVINNAPAAAGTPGWYCTTAGTPGTWKAEANLAA